MTLQDAHADLRKDPTPNEFFSQSVPLSKLLQTFVDARRFSEYEYSTSGRERTLGPGVQESQSSSSSDYSLLRSIQCGFFNTRDLPLHQRLFFCFYEDR